MVVKRMTGDAMLKNTFSGANTGYNSGSDTFSFESAHQSGCITDQAHSDRHNMHGQSIVGTCLYKIAIPKGKTYLISKIR